jgi:SprT protein
MNIEIHQRIQDKINQCSDIVFQKTGQRVIPKLDYNLRGTPAGRGGVRFGEPFISLNKVLLMENVDTMINQTVPHEFAHVVQYTVFKNNPGTGHGHVWKQVMSWFNVPATRCHSYDVTNARVRNVTRYDYVCGCQGKKHQITITRVRRMQAGTHTYRCNVCYQKITPMVAVTA